MAKHIWSGLGAPGASGTVENGSKCDPPVVSFTIIRDTVVILYPRQVENPRKRGIINSRIVMGKQMLRSV